MSTEDKQNIRKTVVIQADEIDRRRKLGKDGSIVPIFTVIEGKNVGTRLKINSKNEKSYIIGRAKSCELSLDDDSVSRQHAQILVEEIADPETGTKKEVLRLQDLGSTNKTLVNGREIGVEPLAPGSKIFLGDTILLFELLDPLTDRFYESILRKAEKANIDPLTQLLSKQFFLEALPEIFNDAVENSQDFSLMIIDIDYFKQVNDKYGHDVGDEALKILANIIKSAIRKEDMAIRYGGDEIVLALPGARLKNAMEVAERIRVSLQHHDCSHLSADLSFSISVGVSSRNEETSLSELMKMADQALYKSKEKGRNQVETLHYDKQTGN